MARVVHVWRLGREAAVLDETEWAQVAPFLTDWIASIKAYQRAHGSSLAEAQQNHDKAVRAAEVYEALTGHALQNVNDIWHVRMADQGSMCPDCGKPFRTPRARLCAECGLTLPADHCAGPLT